MSQKIEFRFKYFTLLSMIYTTVLLSAVLLDYKFISIGPMLSSAATLVISLTFFISDVITEVYGYRRGRQVVWGGVVCLLAFGLIGLVFQNISTPHEYSSYGQSYAIILHLLVRACLSNAFAIVIGAFFNIYFLSKWKALVKGKYFWLRSLGSSAIGESIYTLFVVSLVNFGMVSFSQFIEILVVSYSFKLIFDTLAVIPASFLANFLKQSEGVDVYDFPSDLTPFKYRKPGFRLPN